MSVSSPFYRQGGAGRISLDHEGLHVDGVLVILKLGRSYVPADALFGSAYRARLCEIANQLERGLTAQAVLMTATTSWPDKRVDDCPASLAKDNFDPNQPRGYHARWIKVRDGAGERENPIEDVQYRGHFHDVVVDHLLKGLEKAGAKVGKNIKFTSISGVPAIPDGISLPNGASVPYLIEVKTGGDPPLRNNQIYVYSLVCIGNHVISTDSRLSSFGLPVGKPLPPMEVLAVYTSGPEEPLNFIDLCGLFGLRKSLCC